MIIKNETSAYWDSSASRVFEDLSPVVRIRVRSPGLTILLPVLKRWRQAELGIYGPSSQHSHWVPTASERPCLKKQQTRKWTAHRAIIPRVALYPPYALNIWTHTSVLICFAHTWVYIYVHTLSLHKYTEPSIYIEFMYTYLCMNMFCTCPSTHICIFSLSIHTHTQTHKKQPKSLLSSGHNIFKRLIAQPLFSWHSCCAFDSSVCFLSLLQVLWALLAMLTMQLNIHQWPLRV